VQETIPFAVALAEDPGDTSTSHGEGVYTSTCVMRSASEEKESKLTR
jgi:hypothetical protein